MAFSIPEPYQGFYDETIQRFKLLLQKQVLTGIDLNTLNRWLANFETEEEKYLAAHLLNGLIYRSSNMLCSSFQHLIHCELPAFLQRHGFQLPDGLVAFHEALKDADSSFPIRFVAVDGTFEPGPGKSGGVVIRQFRRHLGVSKAILCRPENIGRLPDSVRYLIFIDDLLGTGNQFEKFANYYGLANLRQQYTMMYSPQLSHSGGMANLAKKFPWLTVIPIESLGPENQFFRTAKDSTTIWHADDTNTVADVKAFCNELSDKGGIIRGSRHSLDLSILFEHGAPNNTLPFYWCPSDRWQPLIAR